MAEVLPPEATGYFCPSPLRRSPPSSTFLVGSPNTFASELQQKYSASQHNESVSTASSSAPPSLHSSHIDLPTASLLSTPSTSFSLDCSESEEEISFPSYGDDSSSEDFADLDPPISPKTEVPCTNPSTESNTTPTNTPEHAFISEDDTAVRPQPTQHVDYLSHDWKEEDIWSSWRHIVSQRKVYGERSRLENASWRTWTKQKYSLRTISPETLNWLKDCDVTWLYGPLQTARHTSEPTSALSKNNSFLSKKPILKKRSMSEVMLQKSLSTSSLLKQAAASVKAQENMQGGGRMRRPILGSRAHSDFVTSTLPSRTISRGDSNAVSSKSTSGVRTPADGEKRHIRFDEKVEQCIAVDAKEADDEEDEESFAVKEDEDESSDDGIVMMKSDRKRPMSRSNSRSSFSGESKTIAKLPSTKLKYRTDSPDIPDHPSHSINTHFWRSPKLSPSPSQETLRPSNPATNFLLHDEDEDDEDDISWEPSGAFSNRVDSLEQLERQYAKADRVTNEGSSGMRRTESGMFMPEDDDEEAVNAGLFGKVMDGVNTARDIAHVIWNVGWRSS